MPEGRRCVCSCALLPRGDRHYSGGWARIRLESQDTELRAGGGPCSRASRRVGRLKTMRNSALGATRSALALRTRRFANASRARCRRFLLGCSCRNRGGKRLIQAGARVGKNCKRALGVVAHACACVSQQLDLSGEQCAKIVCLSRELESAHALVHHAVDDLQMIAE